MEDKENKKSKKCNKESSSKNKEAEKLEESYKLGIKYYEEVDEEQQ